MWALSLGSIRTILYNLLAFCWYKFTPKGVAGLSLINKSMSKTQIAAIIIEFLLWIYGAMNSVPVGLIWMVFSRLFSCPNLKCYLWGFSDNGIDPWEGTQGSVFSQPFTHSPLRFATMAFEKLKVSLDARDILLFVASLQACVIMACLMFGGRARAFWECTQRPSPAQGEKEESKSPDVTVKGEQQESKTPDVTVKGEKEENKTPDVTVKGEKEDNKTPDATVTQDGAKSESGSKPMVSVLIQKRKYKTKPARPEDDEGAAAPSQQADPEPEIITESLSFDNLRSLRKDIARHPGEPIPTWLIRVWDLMGETLQLDGAEARFLGALAQDVAIEQVFVRESKPLSLWARLLTSVRETLVYGEILQEHHMKKTWKTMEEGILRLREMAVMDVLFGRGGQTNNDPDKVRCTPYMWWILSRTGPAEYTEFLASIYREENQETVGAVANKLWIYEGMTHSPMQARISAVETLVAEVKNEQRKLREEMREIREEIKESLQVAPVPFRTWKVRARRPPAREREQASLTEMSYFLAKHEINFL
ncbi:uncharacterized protein [Pithys albifrons albifrons]|uniref:uncharacterized protein n=1 Tax=Pithys albifrons albifrons TaxID=3385563 RepID=UPI003A5CB68F